MQRALAGFRQFATAVALSLGIALTARPAAAQMIPADDPCLQKSVALGMSAAIGIVEWSNTEQLGDALLLLRVFAQDMDEYVQGAKAQVAAGGILTSRALSVLKDFNDCLPWLLNLMSTLEDELKKRSVNLITPSAQAKRQRAEAEERAAVARAAMQALKNAEAGLKVALKKR